MLDLRNYKEVVKEAAKREREADKNWGWYVKSITKNEVKIGWGYLDYIGEDTAFVVRAYDYEDIKGVEGYLPNGCKTYALVGDSRWDDAETFEEGIAIVIHSMACSAHRTY